MCPFCSVLPPQRWVAKREAPQHQGAPDRRGVPDVLRDGRIAFVLKVPREGLTHRGMTPMVLMARRAALIPPPPMARVR